MRRSPLNDPMTECLLLRHQCRGTQGVPAALSVLVTHIAEGRGGYVRSTSVHGPCSFDSKTTADETEYGFRPV
jgi:hypothetical protein